MNVSFGPNGYSGAQRPPCPPLGLDGPPHGVLLPRMRAAGWAAPPAPRPGCRAAAPAAAKWTPSWLAA